MDRFIQLLRSPGAKSEIISAAPTQHADSAAVPFPSDETDETNKANTTVVTISVENVVGYTVIPKARLLDRWLDLTVRVSGSEFVFFTIMAGLLAWAFMGIAFGHSVNWQVIISDVQAILSYIFDSLLMRQQLNGHENFLLVLAQLKSRSLSHERMLRTIVTSRNQEQHQQEIHQVPDQGQHVPNQGQHVPDQGQPVPDKGQHVSDQHVPALDGQLYTDFATVLPSETWFGRMATYVSHILGHIVTVTLYWICILIWIGFGHYCGWSERWQLYINSATSALMVFVFAFLANIREQHSRYTAQCLDAIFTVDATLELKLRVLTRDTVCNESIVIPAPNVNRVQRIINYYADVVGTLVGVAILVVVIIAWLAVGPALHFNSNWWLLIGTYAGLVGMNDGFVLRNIHGEMLRVENPQFATVREQGRALLSIIGADSEVKEEPAADESISYRLSAAIGRVCSHEMAVVLGFLVIVGLIVGASAMRWTTTGQLLCNIPPSIIESFFMVILITGHNMADQKRRLDLQNIYLHRLKLMSFVNALDVVQVKA